MQSITNNLLPFSGRRFILLGDWAQIPPIDKGASRQGIVAASFKSSALWSHCSVVKLTKPV